VATQLQFTTVLLSIAEVLDDLFGGGWGGAIAGTIALGAINFLPPMLTLTCRVPLTRLFFPRSAWTGALVSSSMFSSGYSSAIEVFQLQSSKVSWVP
jgi:hypothetical protein